MIHCDVCGLVQATPADHDRHGDECDNGDPWTHWCSELCWCPDVHHSVMAAELGEGLCDICNPPEEGEDD